MLDANRRPKVSVLIITYNQSAFISQAIDSALAQKTTFAFEIVIGEDCSTDGTREIVEAYVSRYPGKIKPLFQSRNLNKGNFIATYKACAGEYIAWLDGDDYWTDSCKLQKQANFLDHHPDCSICFHKALRVYENDNNKSIVLAPRQLKKFYGLEDLLAQNFIPTCSAMFRAGLFGEFPDWYHTTLQGDWPLHILNAHHGNIGYINEIMATYRTHNGGAWSTQDATKDLKRIIDTYEILKKHLDRKYFKKLDVEQHKLYHQLFRAYLKQGNAVHAKQYFTKAVVGYRYCRDVSYATMLKLCMMAWAPGFYRQLKRLKIKRL